jgi:hypothetical protein
MKQFFPAACLSIFLLMTVQESVMAASVQENPTASAREKKTTPAKKPVPVKSKQAVVKKRPPIASKSKSASEIAKTPLPAAKLDLSLPKDMVEELDPIGTVPLPRHELLPQMFGDKAGSSPFQLNGRLLSNEMQLQLRNEERRDVEGAALDFEFKQ